MLQQLRELDRELFVYFNSMHSPFWDTFMTYMSSRVFWVPMYVLILAYLMYYFRKRSILQIGAMVIAVAAADLISSRFFKPFFARLRPCHDESLSEVVNMVSGCGGRFGFISSHAANTFAFAAALCLILDKRYRLFKVLLLIWASIVSYSRIYLGVHYPGDVLGGALLGILLGIVMVFFYRQATERFSYFHH